MFVTVSCKFHILRCSPLEGRTRVKAPQREKFNWNIHISRLMLFWRNRSIHLAMLSSSNGDKLKWIFWIESFCIGPLSRNIPIRKSYQIWTSYWAWHISNIHCCDLNVDEWCHLALIQLKWFTDELFTRIPWTYTQATENICYFIKSSDILPNTGQQHIDTSKYTMNL